MIAFNEPPKRPIDSEIFIDDVDKLVKENFPLFEGDHPLFKKFGYRTGGFYDGWVFLNGWEDLSEAEKWKYVALCERYWHTWENYRNNKREYEEYKEALKEWSKKNPAFLNTLSELEKKEKEQE